MVVLFLYDDLMTTGKQSYKFKRDRRKVEYAKLTGYQMYSNGVRPVIQYTDDKKDQVVGELHLYDNAGQVLKQMDQLYGYNPTSERTNLFVRKRVENQIRMGGEKRSVYFYSFEGDVTNKKVIPDGQWMPKNQHPRGRRGRNSNRKVRR